MKPRDLKVGNTYVHNFGKNDYFIMLLLDRNSEELIFATYSSEKDVWYIPDIWNYDFENNGFDEFSSERFSNDDKYRIVSSLFEKVL